MTAKHVNFYYRRQDKEEEEVLVSSHRCFGFCQFGFLQTCFADVEIQPPILQKTPLFLQKTGGNGGMFL